MVTFCVRLATNAAANAKATDLRRMMGSIGEGGIPNIHELSSGEATAVSSPTCQPYLYAPISVKKYIGNHISPPFGTK